MSSKNYYVNGNTVRTGYTGSAQSENTQRNRRGKTPQKP